MVFIKTSRTLKPACEKHSTEGTENTTKKTNKSSLRLLMPCQFNARTCSLRKAKTTRLRRLPVLFLRTFRIAHTQNLSPITLSSAAVCKLCVVEYFAKQNHKSATYKLSSGGEAVTMLQRLVRHTEFKN